MFGDDILIDFNLLIIKSLTYFLKQTFQQQDFLLFDVGLFNKFIKDYESDIFI